MLGKSKLTGRFVFFYFFYYLFYNFFGYLGVSFLGDTATSWLELDFSNGITPILKFVNGNYTIGYGSATGTGSFFILFSLI